MDFDIIKKNVPKIEKTIILKGSFTDNFFFDLHCCFVCLMAITRERRKKGKGTFLTEIRFTMETLSISEKQGV